MSAPSTALLTPTWRWVWQHPARVLAFGLGSGLVRPAPGTWGTLVAWGLWCALIAPLDLPNLALAAGFVLALVLGCWACQRTGRELGAADHGGMVWDEIVAFWLVLWCAPAHLAAQTAAFALFRLFDISKPPPIRQLDARLKGGFGVMLDDLLAAAYAIGVLKLLEHWEGVFS